MPLHYLYKKKNIESFRDDLEYYLNQEVINSIMPLTNRYSCTKTIKKIVHPENSNDFYWYFSCKASYKQPEYPSYNNVYFIIKIHLPEGIIEVTPDLRRSPFWYDKFIIQTTEIDPRYLAEKIHSTNEEILSKEKEKMAKAIVEKKPKKITLNCGKIKSSLQIYYGEISRFKRHLKIERSRVHDIYNAISRYLKGNKNKIVVNDYINGDIFIADIRDPEASEVLTRLQKTIEEGIIDPEIWNELYPLIEKNRVCYLKYDEIFRYL